MTRFAPSPPKLPSSVPLCPSPLPISRREADLKLLAVLAKEDSLRGEVFARMAEKPLLALLVSRCGRDESALEVDGRWRDEGDSVAAERAVSAERGCVRGAGEKVRHGRGVFGTDEEARRRARVPHAGKSAAAQSAEQGAGVRGAAASRRSDGGGREDEEGRRLAAGGGEADESLFTICGVVCLMIQTSMEDVCLIIQTSMEDVYLRN